MMGWLLEGYKPTINEDRDGFELLKGVYKTKVNYLRPGKGQEGIFDRYELELEVTEVVKGNGNPGRKFWRRYYQDSGDSLQRLSRDLFTAGISLDTSSQEKFEAGFDSAIGKEVVVDAYFGKFKKDLKTGKAYTPEEMEAQEDRQFFVIKTKDSLDKKDKSTKGKTASTKAPF